MAAVKLKGQEPKRLCDELGRLKGERANFENIWQQVADWMIPRKNDIQNFTTPGESKWNEILDSTGANSLELLSGALHSMLTNPTGYFFGLTTGKQELDDRDATRLWIQQAVRAMHQRLNNSNFQTEVQEFYLDYTGFGMGAMSLEEDEDEVVRFNARPLKEIFVKENSKGRIDCIYRLYSLTAEQIVEDFAEDMIPEKVMKAYKAGKQDKFEILHAVYPGRKLKNYPDQYKKTFPFVSQYVLMTDKVTLDVKGFREFPFFVPRWSKVPGESYGRGPGEKALPEVKTVNKMTETTLRGAQKVVDPPLQVPDDGYVLPIITKPAGLNFYRSGMAGEDRISTIFNDSRIDFGFEAIDRKHTAIREAFYIDQLKLREGPQMTATEVTERTEQALRFLGPMLGRMQSEFLQPLIERLFAIMDRRGEIPPVPAELNGVPLKVQYSSVMAMAQRMSELQNIQRTMAAIAPFASTDPTVLDNFDGDKATHVIAKLLNFPQEILRDKETVDGIRQNRAKQQQAQAQAIQEANQADQAQKLMAAGAKTKASMKVA